MSAPTALHERRVTLLRTVAAFAGCITNVRQLPDGSQPDLMAIDITGQRCMIGDAKATEQPGCTATTVRLARYLRSAQAAATAGTEATFLLACGRLDSARWAATLHFLVIEQTGAHWTHGRIELGGDVVLTVQPRPHLDAEQAMVLTEHHDGIYDRNTQFV